MVPRHLRVPRGAGHRRTAQLNVALFHTSLLNWPKKAIQPNEVAALRKSVKHVNNPRRLTLHQAIPGSIDNQVVGTKAVIKAANSTTVVAN